MSTGKSVVSTTSGMPHSSRRTATSCAAHSDERRLYVCPAVSVGASGSGGVWGCSQGSASWLGEVRSTS